MCFLLKSVFFIKMPNARLSFKNIHWAMAAIGNILQLRIICARVFGLFLQTRRYEIHK